MTAWFVFACGVLGYVALQTAAIVALAQTMPVAMAAFGGGMLTFAAVVFGLGARGVRREK